MKNQKTLSDIFVEGIKASIQFMSAETEALWKSQLRNWKLTARQWETARDRIIHQNSEGRLPSLPWVFSELRRLQEASGNKENYGWVFIRIGGYDRAIRVKSVEGVWVICDLKDKDGNSIQPNHGKPVMQNIPENAEDDFFLMCADNPTRIRDEDMPTAEERAQYIKAINANIEAIARRHEIDA